MRKKNFIRILILLVAVAAIVVMLPRNDRDTYTYEEGQPWRYALLTAPFDIPVYLDTTTYNRLQDSITTNFAPYVVRDRKVMEELPERLQRAGIASAKVGQLSKLGAETYAAGVMTPALKKRTMATGSRQVRYLTNAGDNMASAVDASGIYSTDEAVKWIVDNYTNPWGPLGSISDEDIDALRQVITPNILLDKENDQKFLAMELQGINSGQGKIRQGQRIVDRGEIVTPQIYTNLKTYEEMLSKTDESDRSHSLMTVCAQGLYVLIIFGLFFGYLRVYRRRVYDDMRYMLFLTGLITLFIVVAALMFEHFSLGIYLTPFAIIPVMVLIFVDSRTAFMSLVVTVMISVLMATYQFPFIVSEMGVGFMAILSLDSLTRRSQLLQATVVIFVTYSVVASILVLLNGGELSDLDWRMYLAYAINALLFSVTYVLIIVVEKCFGFTSAMTLVELSDINNPLLRRLSEEAPGTFQHSMQVSTLAADAARAIGANTQLVRTGALYHDIGKMCSPVFFTENQHGVNPHAGLDPQTSAKKIISHVTEGVALAQKAKLPEMVVNFIREHHGRGVTKYFFNTACNAAPEHDVDPAPFTYPGPNPHSKETAILMMADAVEAASRSLKEYTPDSINSLVDKLIDSQIADGMFDESPISFADIQKIKATFKKRLSTIYHTRIAYPDRQA